MWKKENLKFHLWNPNPFDLEVYFQKHKYFDIVEMTYQPDAYFSFAIVLRKRNNNKMKTLYAFSKYINKSIGLNLACKVY